MEVFVLSLIHAFNFAFVPLQRSKFSCTRPQSENTFKSHHDFAGGLCDLNQVNRTQMTINGSEEPNLDHKKPLNATSVPTNQF